MTMSSQLRNAEELKNNVTQATLGLEIERLAQQVVELQNQSKKPDFWTDNRQAQKIMKQIAKLQARIEPWLLITSEVNELIELIKLADNTMNQELEDQYRILENKYFKLKEDLKYSGQFDSYDAIISIYSGAGGTDAQDWAQMLLRMYLRYSETVRWSVNMIDQSLGDEAGIKMATIEISGNFVYGKLKGEDGVHRLVRLSPFNADNLRQTSFAKVEVMPKIEQVEDLYIDDKDLKIDVYRSGGHGGQSVNTTDSAVRITHLPTNIIVAIQNERSQLQNKELALTILRSKLVQLRLEQHKERLDEIRGPNQSAEWGNQIRSYVLHPYKQVKDLRTKFESSDPETVLNGDLEALINSYAEYSLANRS